MEFIHQLEPLVMCEGFKLLTVWYLMVSYVPEGMSSCLVLGFSATGTSTLKNKTSHKFYTLCNVLSQGEGQERNEEVCVSYVDHKNVP